MRASVAAWRGFSFALFCLAKALQMGVFAALAGVLLRSMFALPAIAALWVAIEWTPLLDRLRVAQSGQCRKRYVDAASASADYRRVGHFVCVCADVGRDRLAHSPQTSIADSVDAAAARSVVPARRYRTISVGTRRAVLVQPNIDDETTWTPELLRRTEQQMTLLSLGPLGRRGGVDLIVWPEVPAPFYDSDPEFTGLLASIAKTAHADVLTGIVAHTANGAPLNSALLMGSNGADREPVRQGSSGPVRRIRAVAVRSADPEGVERSWGFRSRQQGCCVVLDTVNSHKIGVFICYESVFPSYIRRVCGVGRGGAFQHFERQLVRQEPGALPASADRAHASGRECPLDFAGHG